MRRTVAVLALVALASPSWAGPGDAGRAGLRYLSWPGKAAAPARASSRPAPLRRPLQAQTQIQTPTQAAPTPPAPAAVAAPPPVRVAAADPARPRVYSLHREYGETPDRPQIPAPFFLDSAPIDLAEPPPPPLGARDARRAQVAADTDPDASPPTVP
jgi:hypothetical protein